jgi:hypothetical protein
MIILVLFLYIIYHPREELIFRICEQSGEEIATIIHDCRNLHNEKFNNVHCAFRII